MSPLRPTPPHVEFLAKRSLLPNAGLKPIVRSVVEGFSVALALGFLGSVIANSAVFLSWRLSFLQLASPSDVITSGLQISWPVLLSVLSTGLGIGTRIAVREAAIRNPRTVDIGFKVLIGLLGVAAAAWAIWAILSEPEKRERLDIWLVSYSFLTFVFGFVRSKVVVHRPGRGLDHDEVHRAMRDMLTIVAGVGFLLIQFNIPVVAKSGFFGDRYRLTDPRLPAACEGAVLWTGERAIVVRCGVGTKPVVLVGPENAILIPRANGED